MSRLLPHYLPKLRKRWGITQPELGFLLKLSRSSVSKFETFERRPTIDLWIGAELIFGETAREVFPGLHRDIEHKVLRQAMALIARLEQRGKLSDQDKIAFLSALIHRAQSKSDSL